MPKISSPIKLHNQRIEKETDVMKRTVAISLMFLMVMMVVSGETHAAEKRKSSWYIGFGIGTGELKVEGETIDDTFSDYPSIDVGQELTLNFGVGKIINPKLHLGFDLSAIRQSAEDDFDSTFDLQVNNYFAAISYFPFEKGLSLKAGAGISAFVYDLDTAFYDKSETFMGTGYLLGVGYDFWLGKSFNLGIHAAYSRQNYNDSDAPDDTEFTNVYLSFYWF
jgi:hypothetical protein